MEGHSLWEHQEPWYHFTLGSVCSFLSYSKTHGFSLNYSVSMLWEWFLVVGTMCYYSSVANSPNVELLLVQCFSFLWCYSSGHTISSVSIVLVLGFPRKQPIKLPRFPYSSFPRARFPPLRRVCLTPFLWRLLLRSQGTLEEELHYHSDVCVNSRIQQDRTRSSPPN